MAKHYRSYNYVSPAKRVWKPTSYVLRYAVMVLLAAFFMFPVVYMLIVSFLSDTAATTPQGLLPNLKDFDFHGYSMVFKDSAFGEGLLNTLLIAALDISGILIAATFCAYGLTKVYFKGQKFFFGLILATVFLPGTVTSIPLFTIYVKIGWINRITPLWLPVWFGGGAMNIFLIRQFMRGIPKSLHEAAIIDGANSFQILIQIIVPLIKPILIYLAITSFMGCWNDYSGPLMYLTNGNKTTLAFELFKKFQKADFKLNAQMAVGVLMMIPTSILFSLFQKELTEGVATLGIKM